MTHKTQPSLLRREMLMKEGTCTDTIQTSQRWEVLHPAMEF